ncbi:S8 family serine peptidase [Candidatus Poriferisodalis sp.]|uniref:S8 family serine peptidase n=1 Tax=Candidatus Poriferisodalis sp. TaxID=3101277 RepID=UPI003B021DD1
MAILCPGGGGAESVGDVADGLEPDGLGPEGSLGPDPGDGLSAAEVVYPNLGSQLSELAVATAAGAESAVGGATDGEAQPGGTNAPQGGEPLLLTVQLDGNRTDVLGFLADNGVTPANVVGDYLEVYVPPALLGPLAQQTGVSRVREMPRPFKSQQEVAAVIDRSLRAHGTAVWRFNGFTGAGVKVGVIDGPTSGTSKDGFTGLRALLGTELPSTVVGRCYSAVGTPTSSLANCDTAGGDDHGTRVAQSVIDVAPEAALYVSNPRTWADIQSAVEWMHGQGVKVIAHSMSWSFHGAADGTPGTTPSPLSTAKWASDNGILWVNSAGNYAKQAWYGAFADSDNDDYHEWSGTGSTAQEAQGFELSASASVFVNMRWDDAWGGAAKDLDLEVRYSATKGGPRTVVATSADLQNGSSTDVPWEGLYLPTTSAGFYWVYAKKKAASAAPSWVQFLAFGASIEHWTASGSVSSPGDSSSPGVLAVGAADEERDGTFAIRWYSSRGPTPDGRIKPDIVGLDCLPSWRGGGAWSFCGTSQSAPVVAGLAALVLERSPASTSQQVAAYLKTNAADQGVPGADSTWGHGLAFLPSDGLATLAEACATTALAGSGTVQGTWDQYCLQDGNDDVSARYYSFALNQQSSVTIKLSTASQFTTRLELRRGGDTRRGGTVEQQQITGRKGTPASMTMSLPAGDYTISARPFEAFVRGSFTLDVQGIPTLVRSGSEVSIAAGADVTEGGDAVFTVSATPPPSAPFTVWVKVTKQGHFGVTAGLQAVTVSTAGSGSLTVPTVDDSADEADGSVTATVDASPRYAVSSSAGSASVAVSDDEDSLPPPVPGDECVSALTGSGEFETEFTDSCNSVQRGDSHRARFYTFTLDKPSTVTIDLSTPYVPPHLYLRSGSGQKDGAWLRQATFPYCFSCPWIKTVQIRGSLPAGDYTIEATTKRSTSYYINWNTKSTTGPFVLKVAGVPTVAQPAPVVPVVSVSGGGGVTEGGDAIFTVSAVPKPAADLDVEVTVAAVGDFGATTGAQTVTVPVSGSVKVTVATVSDSVDEADGSVSVSLDAPAADAGYTVSATAGSASVAVSDDDDPPLPVVSVSSAGGVTEGSAARFTLSASPKPSGTMFVQVKVAQSGDFGVLTGSRSVGLPSGGSVSFSVPTAGDSVDEADGSVSVQVMAALGYTVSPTAGSASVAVSDDDDPPPVVPVVSVAAGGGVTEGGDAIFTVSAVPKPAADLDVEVTVAAVGDFGAVAGAQTVTVPVSGSVKVTVATVGDSVDEADGSVSVSLDAPAADAGYTVSATAGSATVAVSDDDDPPPVVEPEPEADPPSVEADPAPVVVPVCTGSPELSVADASAVPGGMLVFEFSLSCRASGSVVAYYYLVRDGAIAGSTQAVRFAAGVTSGSASVAVGGSSAVSLTVVYAPGTARPFRGLKATGVIVETLPVVSVSAGAGVSEGADAVFTVSAVPAPTSPVNVVVDVSQSGDFVVSSARRTVELSGASATLTIATSDDAVDEADGSVTVTLVDGASYDVGTSRAATVSVADDDVPPPVVSITAGSGGAEGTSATFAVTASSAPTANLEVSVTVAASGDFGVTAGTRTATILAGTTGATLTVATADDSVDEPDGSVTATLAAGSGYAVGSPASRTVQVTDDDDPPVVIPEVSVTAGGAVSEGSGAVFTVTASEPKSAGFDVAVSVSASGEWGVAGGSRTVSFAANAATATLTVPTVGDSTDEADGAVSVALDAPAADAGYTISTVQGTATVGVSDDDVDPLTVYMIFFSRSIDENGTGYGNQAQFAIAPTRALRSWEKLTVPLSVTGGDEGTHWTMRDRNDPDAVFANEFEVVFGPGDRGVVLEPGDQRVELVLTAVPDSDWVDQAITVSYGTGARAPTLNGSTEGVTLGISWGPDGVERADGSTTVVIIDSDEPPPQVSITAATGGTEGADATFTIAASAPVAADLDVSVDVASTGDWGATVGTQTATIPQGATQATLTVATTNDSADEPDGSITATLAAGSGYTVGPQATQSAHITDDDDPPPEPAVPACTGKPTVSVADATAARGDDLEFVISLSCRSTSAVTAYYFISHGGSFSGGEILTIDSGDIDATVSVPTAGVNQTIGLHVLYTIGAANSTAKATSTITN